MGTWLTKRSTRNDWSRRFILAISSDLLAYTRYDKLCICMCVSACVCVRLWVGMSVAAHTVHSVNNSIVSSVIATAWIHREKKMKLLSTDKKHNICLFVCEWACMFAWLGFQEKCMVCMAGMQFVDDKSPLRSMNG